MERSQVWSENSSLAINNEYGYLRACKIILNSTRLDSQSTDHIQFSEKLPSIDGQSQSILMTFVLNLVFTIKLQ